MTWTFDFSLRLGSLRGHRVTSRKKAARAKAKRTGKPRRASLERLEDRCLLTLLGAAPPVANIMLADAFTSPDVQAYLNAQNTLAAPLNVAASPGAANAAPYGTTAWETSEYMIGDVAVTVVLLESTGPASTEDWTPTEISDVKREVNEGLQWWENTFTAWKNVKGITAATTSAIGAPHLKFNIDFTYADNPVPTPYEPINRPYTDEGLWIDSFLSDTRFGKTNYNTGADYRTDVRTWDQDQRLKTDANGKNSDWAFTVFIVDSSNDPDGYFADRERFAYAYLGGPFLVMNYKNDSWGIDKMGQVLAHETGHIFYALDEYARSDSYDERSGYYNTQNVNAVDGRPAGVPARVASIMGEQTLQDPAYLANISSPSSLEMVGWRDRYTNQYATLGPDGTIDALGSLTLTGSGGYDPNTQIFTFTGTSSVHPWTNDNSSGTSKDVTISTVGYLQYRLDPLEPTDPSAGGNWVDVNSYYADTASVSYSGNMSGLSAGSHTIQFRTIDKVAGIASPVITFSGDGGCDGCSGGDGGDGFEIPTGKDFGDAPSSLQSGFTSSYPVTLAENGAQHWAIGPRLGPNRDREANGVHSIGATADDTTGIPDDEDGVTWPSALAASTAMPITATVQVNLQHPAATNRLDAWIDFNRDGDWTDLGEQILANVDLGTSTGLRPLTFTVPQINVVGSNVVLGDTYARFRVSSAGGLAPTGLANNGEVEDYLVKIDKLATIQGTKWNDLNANGIRDTITVAGNKPDVVFVVDTSSSTGNAFGGDVDSDGNSDNILYAELYAGKIFNQQLILGGFGAKARMSIIDFDSIAINMDMDLDGTSTPALTLATLAEERSKGDPAKLDVDEVLNSMIAYADFGTNFDKALQQAINTFNSLGTAQGDGNLIFLSDGGASVTASLVATLNNMKVTIHAYGIGAEANMANLRQIDPNAVQVLSTQDLLGAFGGLQGDQTQYSDPPLAGWRIYVDSNDNGKLDAGEPSAVTDANGSYTLANLFPGTYKVREVPQDLWYQTFPANPEWHSVTVSVGQSLDGVDFGNTYYSEDWGDAPSSPQSGFTSSYPVTQVESGARHTAVGPRLGANRDTEANGIPSAGAVGDDQDRSVDDEDGVTLPIALYPSANTATTASLQVSLQNANTSKNLLDAWIDFNRDGDWTDVGEQIFKSQALGATSGLKTLSFTMPKMSGGNVVLGTTYARFRLSTAGGLLPTGAAADGEVEDYRVTLAEPFTIRGTVWDDNDGDAILDSGELGRAGWTVYVDVNKNGKLDSTTNPPEPSAVTDASGGYAIAGLLDGTYDVRVSNVPTWWRETKPGTGLYRVTLPGLQAPLDFGYQRVGNGPPVLTEIGPRTLPIPKDSTSNSLVISLTAYDPDGDPLVFTATGAQTGSAAVLAQQLDQNYRFVRAVSESFNRRGWNEKYFAGIASSTNAGGVYFVLPSGEVYAWNSSLSTAAAAIATNHTKLGQLDAWYHADVKRVYDAQPKDLVIAQTVYDLNQQYNFYAAPSERLNSQGKNEKYFLGKPTGPTGDNPTGTYFILPDGKVYSWKGGMTVSLAGIPLGVLEPDYYNDLRRLYKASTTQSPVSEPLTAATVTVVKDALGKDQLKVELVDNQFRGNLFVTAVVSDGMDTDRETFVVNVVSKPNRVPTLTQAGDQFVSYESTPPPITVTITSGQTIKLVAADANGDPVTFEATGGSQVETLAALAQQLDQTYSLSAATSLPAGLPRKDITNNDVHYMRGVTNTISATGWYFILSNGDVYAWKGAVPSTPSALDVTNHAFLGTLSNAYYVTLSTLYDRPRDGALSQLAYDLDQKYVFVAAPSESINWRGMAEKYFLGKPSTDNPDGSYFILSNGYVYEWKGSSISEVIMGGPLGILDASYYTSLAKLYSASPPPSTTPLGIGVLAVDPNTGVLTISGTSGTFLVTATVTDGTPGAPSVGSYSRSFTVVVNPPLSNPILSPADNATGVVLSTNLVITFSEPIQKGVGNVVLRKSSDHSMVQTFDVVASAVTVSGTTVTIDPPVNLADGTGYYVEVAAGAFKDSSGNSFAGISGPTAWNFTTIGISSLNPADNAVGVAASTNLVISFSAGVVKGTGDVVIRKLADGSVVQTINVTSTAVTVSGTTVTINPPVDLAESTAYFVEVAAGAFKDLAGNPLAGNPLAGISGPILWDFTTVGVQPTVISLSPADNAMGVVLGTNLVITFSEPIAKGVVGTVVIKKSSDNSTVETFDVATSTAVTVSGTTVTINPSVNLADGTGYYVEVAAGAFKDLSGNAFAGIAGTTTWNFTTIGISSLNPVDNAVGVAVGTNLVISFSAGVGKGAGNVVIKKVAGGSPVQTIDVTSSAVTVSGNTVTINPPDDLAENMAYYVEVAAGAFKDLAGNVLAGISGPTTWNFTTLAVPPTVTSLSPADNATGVALGTMLQITFSEPIQKGVGNVVLKRSSDNSVVQTFDVATSNAVFVTGAIATIDPSVDLVMSTGYYVEVVSGAFKDLSGVAFAGISGPTMWNFTTVGVPPLMSSLTPADDAVAVALGANLVLTFNKSITRGTGNVVIKKSSDGLPVQTIDVATSTAVTVSGTNVTINPPNDLAENTGYYVEVAAGAFKDLLDNPFAGISGSTAWNFATVAVLPTVSSLSPADNATGVVLSTNLVITFSENITRGTGTVVIKKPGVALPVETIDVASTRVTFNGTRVTIDPPVNLADGTGYYVEVAPTAFIDLSGNAFAGISGSTTWNFTTVGMISLNPLDNATGVAAGTNLVISFSAGVDKGTGNVLIKRLSDDFLVHTINVASSTAVTVSGTTVTINPPADLAEYTKYYVEVPAGAFKDLAGNPLAGISGPTTWNFTTVVMPPTVSSLSPTDNAAGVMLGTNLVITFSENIYKGVGNVLIKKPGVALPVETIDVASTRVTFSGTKATIDPSVILEDRTGYYVEVDSGAFIDDSGNAFAGIFGATTWNFTTVGISSLNPVNSATGVPTGANLVIGFSANVVKGTGNVLIKTSGGVLVQVIAVTSTAVTVSGTVVVINPPVDLAESTVYYVEVETGAFKDLSGNPFAAIGGPTAWAFTTVGVPPQVSSLSPANNATGVAVGKNLVIMFNEIVQKVPGSAGEVLIKKSSDNSVAQRINVTDITAVAVSGATVTINPPNDLLESTGYYVVVPAGVFEDLAGNDFAGISSPATWRFTTVGVIYLNPANNATGVDLASNLVITFNTNIIAGSGVVVIRKFDGSPKEEIDVKSTLVTFSGATATINPMFDLVENTRYYVEVPFGAFEDSSGYRSAAITGSTTWNFTTVGVPPRLSSLSPLSNATGVAVGANLEITFNESVLIGAGNVVIRTANNTLVETIIVADVARVNISGPMVTINPTADLAASTGYYVEIARGAFKDLAGNVFAGITGTTTWKFTTGAVAPSPPAIVAGAPAASVDPLADTLSYQLGDTSGGSAVGTATVQGVGEPSYQNPVNRFDVDGDGQVAARDVLILVNYINLNGMGPIPGGTLVSAYLDVVADGSVTAQDVLGLVNALNTFASAGEGEAADSHGIPSPATAVAIVVSPPLIVAPTTLLAAPTVAGQSSPARIEPESAAERFGRPWAEPLVRSDDRPGTPSAWNSIYDDLALNSFDLDETLTDIAGSMGSQAQAEATDRLFAAPLG
ncbi:MAG: Ig-like domain-containing protein [Planctomycetota bacterium]|nr:Ig-like domain-containing protein [Planctomycetota bacterium]